MWLVALGDALLLAQSEMAANGLSPLALNELHRSSALNFTKKYYQDGRREGQGKG
jgi:hypothetical protein